jgi:hypothetical protein
VVGLPFLVREWTVTSFFCVSVLEALLLTLILGLFNPRRFRWATRCVTGIVFCGYLAYAIHEVILSGSSLEAGTGGRADASPRSAIWGFIGIGLPCLWYTLFGRFSLRVGGKSGGGAPDQLDKIDTIDLDI